MIHLNFFLRGLEQEFNDPHRVGFRIVTDDPNRFLPDPPLLPHLLPQPRRLKKRRASRAARGASLPRSPKPRTARPRRL